jgi:hypothetical protein
VFEREDWMLFKTLPTLAQKAGLPVFMLPAGIMKEVVDNALDAGGSCKVDLLRDDHGQPNGFWVEDDGPGIDGIEEKIAALFSIARPMTSSKLLRLPTRGALGNGLRVVAGAVLASGGSLTVATHGRKLLLIPQEDGSTNYEWIGGYEQPGTRVEVRLGKSLPIYETSLDWSLQAIQLSQGKSSYGGKTSPHWYDSDSFFDLLQAAKDLTVRDLVQQFDGCTGGKAGQIASRFKGRATHKLSRREAEELLGRARQDARAVNPLRLGCLGPDVAGLPSSYAKVTGTFSIEPALGSLNAEIPFAIEAYAEIAEEQSLGVSVNRTPIIGQVRSGHHKDKMIIHGGSLHTEFMVGRRPLAVWLNIDTPYMPIISDGKSPDLARLQSPIEDAIDKVVSRAKRHAGRDPGERKSSEKNVILEHLQEAIEKNRGGSGHRFSIRQLYYAVRPYVLEQLEKELEYNYFTKVITDYESEHGDIPGMYRDARGILYHPHTGEEIQLGTIQVGQYERPAWTFRNVLYCEKEGFFPILKDSGFPERFDCVLMTSKGFASRAARDLIDMLGETDEEVRFFCIHDADAAGTMIYQALQEATKARDGRKVRIINLGLDPEEALEMGLQVEEPDRKAGRTPAVADYLSEEWEEWLQSHRVELNAMTTPQFLAWLEGKMELYGVQKVIPPEDVMVDRLEQGVRLKITQNVTEAVLRNAGIDDMVEHQFQARSSSLRARQSTLADEVKETLEEDDSLHWTAPVDVIAEAIAQDEPEAA